MAPMLRIGSPFIEISEFPVYHRAVMLFHFLSYFQSYLLFLQYISLVFSVFVKDDIEAEVLTTRSLNIIFFLFFILTFAQ